MSPVRLMVADDSKTYRSALCSVLRQLPEIDVVAVAQDGEEALRLVGELEPDLLLLDIQMPKMNGVEVLRRLRTERSPVRVVVVSGHTEAHYRRQVLAMGASAYVPKGNGPLLFETIQQVARD